MSPASRCPECKALASETRQMKVELRHLRSIEVDPATECWGWKGTISNRGYGVLRVRKVTWRAHRWFYERFEGPIPEGLFLDHLCRNRACVNPDHLEPVTIGENIRRGSLAKLNPDRVREIRSSDETNLDLAKRFGVSDSLVCMVRKGRIWKDVV